MKVRIRDSTRAKKNVPSTMLGTPFILLFDGFLLTTVDVE